MSQLLAVLHWTAVVVWMGVIFFLSSLPTTKVRTNIPDVLPHFVEYSILGTLVVLALISRKKEPPSPSLVGWAVFIGIFYAVSDEFHQLFVPGRHTDPKDLAVDAVGVVLAVLFVYWIRVRRRRT